MSARIATAVTGQSAQYIGTTQASPPTAAPGSATCRRFNGVGDRVVLGRSVDLGESYLMVLTFWRLTASVLPDDHTAQRLFTQYCVGGSRVAVGLNRDRLSITCTDSSGTPITVESRIKVYDVSRHFLGLSVTPAGAVAYLDGREAARVEAALAAPDYARAVIGADTAARFFSGYIDDFALYQSPPSSPDNWLRYYRRLVLGSEGRDYTAATFASGLHQAVVSAGGRAAVGFSTSPNSRVPVGASFRTEAELPDQALEFVFTRGEGDLRVGVFNSLHDLAADDLGKTQNSYAWLPDGSLEHGAAVASQGLPEWGANPVVALIWTPSDRKLSLWVDGEFSHNVTLPAGTWTAAVSLGTSSVTMSAGQGCFTTLPTDTGGLPAVAASKLTTEFRHLRLGELAAPLDDGDQTLRDARTGDAGGTYLQPAALEGSFTGDPFDKARRVAGGIQVPGASYTRAALEGFFFALALSPTSDDLSGEKVILESPDRWGLKLLDGKLYGWCGEVQVGATGTSLAAGGRYMLGLTVSPAGKLLMWAHVGYILESGDSITSQTQGDVWVGSKADGSAKFEGQVSHLVLSSKTLPLWKQQRLKLVYAWDAPSIDGETPSTGAVNPPDTRKVFEVSYRDALANGWVGLADMDACFVSAVAFPPDATVHSFRMLTKAGATPYVGTDVRAALQYGRTAQEVSKFSREVVIDILGADEYPSPGSTLMVGDEIMRVDGGANGVYTVTRGCVDTQPAIHGAGTPVWFYGTTWPADPALLRAAETYTADQVVSVKMLSRSPAGETNEGFAPVDSLTVRGRRKRPYPPDSLTINGLGEESGTFLSPEDPFFKGSITVSWKHRDKINQGAALVGVGESTATRAPAGVSYKVRVYSSTGALLHESAALTNVTSTYDYLDENYQGRVQVAVVSIEGGLECLQAPRVEFDYQGFVTTVIATENDEAFELEDGNLMAVEDLTRARATHPEGSLPDYWNLQAEEGPIEGDVLGVKVSEMPALPAVDDDTQLPALKGGTNYKTTLKALFDHLISRLPAPAPGKSAYELAVAAGFDGSEAEWRESLRGATGPSTNMARRIYTINNASGAIVCNWANYDEIRLRLVGDVVLTFQGAVDGQGCLLKIKQDATGGRKVTIAATVRFNALIREYQATPGAGLADKIGFIYDSADSSYDFVSLVPGISVD